MSWGSKGYRGSLGATAPVDKSAVSDSHRPTLSLGVVLPPSAPWVGAAGVAVTMGYK